MPKIFLTILTIALLFTLIFSTLTLVEAKESKYSPDQESITKIEAKNEEIKNRKITKLKKSEYKIVNGEIDTQFSIQMTKEEEKNFDKCKSDEKLERKPRYKNQPTACLKKPTQVNDHITDQDYNLLWQAVNQQVEQTAGVDMNTELPLSEFVEDVTNTGISSQSENSKSSSASSLSNSIVNFNSTSSSAESAIPSNSTALSSISIASSQPKSISFLDIIFGSVKADAATNDGWRLPYAAG
jgi:hypothetical protein